MPQTFFARNRSTPKFSLRLGLPHTGLANRVALRYRSLSVGLVLSGPEGWQAVWFTGLRPSRCFSTRWAFAYVELLYL
jgi:hypothetical protein